MSTTHSWVSQSELTFCSVNYVAAVFNITPNLLVPETGKRVVWLHETDEAMEIWAYKLLLTVFYRVDDIMSVCTLYN